MTEKTLAEKIEVMKAALDGKEIECQPLFIGWNWIDNDYRVKPEPRKPREFWVTLSGQVWSKEDYAKAWFNDEPEFKKRVIRVREVLDPNQP